MLSKKQYSGVYSQKLHNPRSRPALKRSAVRDVGAVHRRLAPGSIIDVRLEGDSRIVAFSNDVIVRELIIDVHNEARRFDYAAVVRRYTP